MLRPPIFLIVLASALLVSAVPVDELDLAKSSGEIGSNASPFWKDVNECYRKCTSDGDASDAQCRESCMQLSKTELYIPVELSERSSSAIKDNLAQIEDMPVSDMVNGGRAKIPPWCIPLCIFCPLCCPACIAAHEPFPPRMANATQQDDLNQCIAKAIEEGSMSSNPDSIRELIESTPGISTENALQAFQHLQTGAEELTEAMSKVDFEADGIESD